MDDETSDRVITSVLVTLAGVGTSVEAPVIAPIALTVMVIALLAAIFGPEEILTAMKWVFGVIVVLLILLLLAIGGAIFLLLHAVGLA